MNFAAWLAARGLEEKNLNAEALKTLKAAYQAEIAAGDPPADPPGDEEEDDDPPVDAAEAESRRIRAAAAAEVERVAAIRAICAQYTTPAGVAPQHRVGTGATQTDVLLEAHAIREGWGRDATELVALRASRPAGPSIHERSHEADCNAASLSAALLIRAGLNPVENSYQIVNSNYVPRRKNANVEALEQAADRGHRFRDMSLFDVAREAMRIEGRHVGHGRAELFQALKASGSGGTLTNIFTTNFSAMLLQSYLATLDTTQGWTRDGEAPNFQSNERTQIGKAAAMTKHKRGGKADHMTLADRKEAYKLARYSKQFVVDEMDLIDDRFGAIEQVSPAEMGEAAAQLRPDLVYAILLANAALDQDSVALFHSTHANLNTTTALAAAGLKTCINGLNIQTLNGRNLDKSGPTYVIVPEALSFTLDQLIESPRISNDSGVGEYNPLRSRTLIGVSDARLDNGVTDPNTGTAYSGSTSTWYAARNSRYTIEVGYLRGSGKAPQMRSFVLTEGQWGVGWDVVHDIAAKALDYLGLAKNTA